MTLEAVDQARVLTLENSEIKLTIRSDLGGRIDQLEDLKTGHSWLWHPPQYNPEATRYHTVAMLHPQEKQRRRLNLPLKQD